jgi:hypothetical protein
MGNPLVRSGRLSFRRFVGTCHVRLRELFEKVMKRREVSIGDGSRQDSLDVMIARNQGRIGRAKSFGSLLR